MEKSFICPRCGNSDPKYFGYKNGEIYCRKCISFCGEAAEFTPIRMQNVHLSLNYHLSKKQKELSARLVDNYKNGIDTLVYAVCGSGKTEISYGVIGYAVSQGHKVGFALPRRDVVIELYVRLKNAFPQQKVVAVYGGHASSLEGDIIILTTHQLYRYEDYFDLLVMDEVDAFPYKDNDVLIAFRKRATHGHMVVMSATPSKKLVAEYKNQKGHQMLTLHTRFHNHPIPVPKIKICIGVSKIPYLIKKLIQYKKEGKQCFVFVPTIEESKSLFNKLRIFASHGNYVSSKKEDREKVIADFKEGKYSYLITTSVLERGITVANLQVIIYKSDNHIYEAATLIQIAGRAGRKACAPDGEVIFLSDKVTDAMEKAIEEIKYCNTHLQNLLPANKGK